MKSINPNSNNECAKRFQSGHFHNSDELPTKVLDALREKQAAQGTSYAWVNQKSGVVQLPRFFQTRAGSAVPLLE